VNKGESLEKYKTYYMRLSMIEKLEKAHKEYGMAKSHIVNEALAEWFAKRGLYQNEES
jgi:hypothetical protein